MPRNLVKSHFETAGIFVEGERSVFPVNKPVLDSFMSGMLVPLGDPLPVFPGVKLDLYVDMVVRSNTMIVPPLDGMYLDVFSVWVPHRIVWNHMPQFLGDPESVAWTQLGSYIYPSVPIQTLNSGCANLLQSSVIEGSVICGNNMLAGHYGLIQQATITASTHAIYDKPINILSIRGYYSIWNYLFRDENYQRPVLFSKGDTGISGEFGYLIRDYSISPSVNISNFFNLSVGTGSDAYKALLMPVNKLHDAVTSVLPQPQFGNAVTISMAGTAPILATLDSVNGSSSLTTPTSPATYYGLKTRDLNGVRTQELYVETSGGSLGGGVYADLASATAISVNAFRTSVMYQRYLEALARGGRRMPEYMHSIYGVKNTAAACDYPDLLARKRYMLGVNQVVATADSSGSGWTSHLGDTGAYSLTVLKDVSLFEKDFSEFGYLHILYCVRADNRYSSFIQEHFFRSSILDEYNPFFDHIGDVEMKNYMVNSKVATAGNFGFQEAWWSERTQVAMANNALNKDFGSLKYWILGESLSSSVDVCTPGFLCFNPAVFDDVFVSPYYSYPQFIMDARIHGKAVKRMSQHSIPGIVGRI